MLGWCWWWVSFAEWLITRGVRLYFHQGPVSEILSTPQHHQDLNLCRAWVQVLLNEVAQLWKPLHHFATDHLLDSAFCLDTEIILNEPLNSSTMKMKRLLITCLLGSMLVRRNIMHHWVNLLYLYHMNKVK